MSLTVETDTRHGQITWSDGSKLPDFSCIETKGFRENSLSLPYSKYPLTSFLELLFDISSGSTWSLIQAPKGYRSSRNRTFEKTIVPSLSENDLSRFEEYCFEHGIDPQKNSNANKLQACLETIRILEGLRKEIMSNILRISKG